jgi:hypothetical protein
MQAQDLNSGLWSIGVRTGGTQRQVLDSVERGEITRTWPMRGTLHWVAAEDVGWMTRLLSSSALRAGTRALQAEGLGDGVIARAAGAWAAHLARVGSMTRVEAAEVLQDNGIDAGGQRGYHLLVRQCQLGLLCQGPIREVGARLEPTFVLQDAWIPRPRRPQREEALALVAERYVAGHGPVTERDLAGWCGQPLRVVREAVALTDGRVGTETIGHERYLVHADAPEPGRDGVLLLPGFDEWMLGYKDRRAQVTADQERTVVPGGNGMFRGTVVAGSVVVATWRRGGTARALTVEVSPFEPLPARTTAGLRRAVAAYGRFLGREVTVRVLDG